MIRYQCDRCGDAMPPTMSYTVAADIVDDQSMVVSMAAHREWHLCVGCLHEVAADIEGDDDGLS